MDYSKALLLAESMKERLFMDALSLSDQANISDLYLYVFGRELRKCNCKDKYKDALIEILNYLTTHKNMSTARLKKGILLNVFGEGVYSNANLTDEVAREYLATYPDNEDMFDVLPEPEQEINPELVSAIVEKLDAKESISNIKKELVDHEIGGEQVTAGLLVKAIKKAKQLIKEAE